ncbi:MAG: nucleotidyltransferase family protein [Candidatus Omnitrophica bacterium]|nr:nucleotidyltransferase family protein [Candidatus Omnitrophota bacterium]
MKALILAAGYGTRLYPYTQNRAKSLLKIGKRPIIDYLIEKIEKIYQIQKIIVVTNDRFFSQFKRWKVCSKTKKQLRIINDLTRSPQDRLGAIGDIEFTLVKEGSDNDLLVLGGDNIFEGNLASFLSFARKKKPSVSIGVFDIKNRNQAKEFGVVRLNRNMRIIELWEKPKNPKSTYVAMCLYYFPKGKLPLITQYLSTSGVHRDTLGSYIRWLLRKSKVYGFEFKGFWHDIGHHYTYTKAKEMFK